MTRPRIVLLGMMTKIPVAGVVWQTLHYLVGLERLGCEPFYVEAHARTPSMLMQDAADDSSLKAAEFIARVLGRFGLGDRWAFHALHDDGRCYGMSEGRLSALYASADLIINLHGGTEPRAEHAATNRLVYLETDPVEVEVQLSQGRQETVDYLGAHVAHFTFGENYGAPDCGLPVTDLFDLRPTRQPVVLDFWGSRGFAPGAAFTTIGNWQQQWREIVLAGRRYSWSKHEEFLKFLDLPARSKASYELALSSLGPEHRSTLQRHGWGVREAADLSGDIDRYREFICGSRGEFTVAKEQNVRLRTGWFSDRSATYLAAGRPVITQDTGFGNVLPVGEGLFPFLTLDDAVGAVEAIASDYMRHSRAAQEIAHEYFDSSRVLGELLAHVGVHPRPQRRPRHDVLQADLVLEPLSRRPLRLRPATLDAVIEGEIADVPAPASRPDASIVVVTLDNLVVTKLALASVLANTDGPAYELIVVDNGSRDGTGELLASLSARMPWVRVVLNGYNAGFAAAVNQAVALARSDRMVLLNNDTITPPGWLRGLMRHLDDPAVGCVGPVTNRIGNEAEVATAYATYGQMLDFAAARARDFVGRTAPIRTPAMFCLAMRRDVWTRVGPLDERYGAGLLEDDDYAERVRRAGLRLECAEDVFVHHFGEASFGKLYAGGEYMRLLRENQRSFEAKWEAPWEAYERRADPDYERLRGRIRETVHRALPAGATVGVVSRGDDELLRLDSVRAWHFPQVADGTYAGSHPADGADAVHQVELLREKGAAYLLFPRTAFWWLDFYAELRRHLEATYTLVFRDESCVVYSLSEATVHA